MSGEIKIHGIEQLRAILNRLPDDISQKVAEKSLRDGAKEVLNEAKNLVKQDTGKLKDSLAIKTVRGGIPTVRVYARRNKGQGGWHANLLEFGTAPHMIGNVSHPGTSPRPFMRPALASKKTEVLTKILEGVVKHCRSVLKREMK